MEVNIQYRLKDFKEILKVYHIRELIGFVKTPFWVKSSKVNHNLSQGVVAGARVMVNHMENQIPTTERKISQISHLLLTSSCDFLTIDIVSLLSHQLLSFSCDFLTVNSISQLFYLLLSYLCDFLPVQTISQLSHLLLSSISDFLPVQTISKLSHLLLSFS